MDAEGFLGESPAFEPVVDVGLPDAVVPPCRAAAPRHAAPLGEWLALVAARDEQAMRHLHRAVATQVHRVVARVVSDPHLADEVVGECFWQVWREAAHFDGSRGSVASWVAMIARSRALDAVRRRKALAMHEEPLPAEYDDACASSDPSPVACLEKHQRKRCLDAALARIDPMQRQLLALSFDAGLSHEQVAQHCGLALGTVKSHIRRGLTQMRGHCERAGLRP
jgi:RNA polymerase sigma-70 factor (ECF subfamily)